MLCNDFVIEDRTNESISPGIQFRIDDELRIPLENRMRRITDGINIMIARREMRKSELK